MAVWRGGAEAEAKQDAKRNFFFQKNRIIDQSNKFAFLSVVCLAGKFHGIVHTRDEHSRVSVSGDQSLLID